MSDDGSEDSAPRPKRKIKRVVVMSSNSSSDSDESIAPTGTRRKRMRVISDAESDSSGSSVVGAGTRRKRTLPKLRDSDGDSDTSGWATDHSDAPKTAPAPAKPASGFASDSSEGNSDKCSICLMRFTTQEVGTPQNCEHIFCLDCITEWSKNVNTCPVDRLTFDSIVVRTCAGGRVLRTEPVKVVERRPSVEMLVIEDPTVCEICGNSENEESMLLCDGCDLGFHMQCLTPPLTEIPVDQWLCPNCDNILDVIHLSEVEDLFSGLVDIDLPLLPRPTPLREPRNVRRSSRNISLDEPSTSTGRRGGSSNVDAAPSTSRGTRTGRSSGAGTGATRRRTAGPQRRKYKRRRTKTVIIEYEVEENGKFPITKRVKRRVPKRRTKKRQPRTAARRSYVRASVRAKLANLEPRAERAGWQAGGSGGGGGAGPALALQASRRRAGVPALSLFGRRDQLDYFADDDEHAVSEGATTAVAVRPTHTILSAYRQARRKMVTIPSPPHASSAPDLLSSILDSQEKLHSKNSVVSISVDGSVNIKVQTRKEDRPLRDDKKLDLSAGQEEATRQAPSYPGQSRGGGWGGGYRGGPARDQPGGNFGNRAGGYRPDDGYRPGYGSQGRPPHQNSFAGNMRRDEPDGPGSFPRRQYSYPPNDDNNFDRNRRPPQGDASRGANFPPNGRPDDRRPGRHSLGPAWQPYAARREPPPPARHSFAGSENPLDMRMGHVPPSALDARPPSEADDAPRPYRPLPEPPVFKFDKTPDVEKSEDERSDSGLVIDTEKYDPTEPTNDDDESGDEPASVAGGTPEAAAPGPPASATAAAGAGALAADAPPHSVVQNIMAELDAGALRVPAGVLDDAVRLALRQHRHLLAPAAPAAPAERSDDDSDGDCPNFSIYSAASVHIANDSGAAPDAPPAPPADDMTDLVQEDDEPAPAEPRDLGGTPGGPSVKHYVAESDVKRKTEEELKEKVSKRCPITTNPRNPIKIKLTAPSLMRRHMALYDDEEPADDAEPVARADSSDEEPKRTASDEPRADSIGDGAVDKPEEVHKIDASENVKSDEEEEITEDLEEKKVSPEIEPIVEPAPVELKEVSESNPASDGEDEDDNEDGEKSPRGANTEAASDEEKIEDEDEKEPEKRDDSSGSDRDEKLEEDEVRSDDGNDDISDAEFPPASRDSDGKNDDALEKMTESISETEDERSYTPCLDENKSKDASLEADKEKGIEGLDTEMISEDEGNGMFSDDARERSPPPSPAAPPAPLAPEDGEILDKRRDKPDPPRRKKRKDSKRDSKKEGKEKSKKAKKSEVTFKKLSKSGKERNYRDKDRDKDKEDRPRRDSSAERKRKRKEKRKDLERYDVRTLVTEKRRRVKDPFGRDVSPRRSRSRSPSLARSSPAERESSPARVKRTRSRSRSRSRSRVLRRSPSPLRRRRSKSPVRARRTPTPARRSASPRRGGASPSPRRRGSGSPPLRRLRASLSPPPRRLRASLSPPARRARGSPSPPARRASRTRRRAAGRTRKRRGSGSGGSPGATGTGAGAAGAGKRRRRARSERRPRRSPKRRRARRSAARDALPHHAPAAWSPVWGTPGESVASCLLSPRTPPPEPAPPPPQPPPPPQRPARRHDRARRRARSTAGASKEVFTSGDNILVSVSFKDQERSRGDSSPERAPRRDKRASKRRRRAAAAAAAAAADAAATAAATRPVAIIDLERSPFRELTPSPRNVIVLSDSDHGGAEPAAKEKPPPASAAAPATAPAAAPASGPRTPPAAAAPPPDTNTAHPPDKGHRLGGLPAAAGSEEARGPLTPPEPPSSPDAYDPFEPTRSPSASPSPSASQPPAAAPPAAPPVSALHPAPSPPRTTMTLEAAQKTNLSADDVIDRRPLSPMEKVMALLQSTRDVSPEPPPPDTVNPPQAASPPLAASGVAGAGSGPGGLPGGVPGGPAAAAPAPRIVLPEAPRAPPKLFLAKPSPIKSDPIKPMQARPVRRAESECGGASPYSPGSSDFGDLFEPPSHSHSQSHSHSHSQSHPQRHKRDIFDSLVDKHTRPRKSAAAKVPVKLNKKKGKTQVGVKIDEDNLKILDDLPSSAVEMQVKSKVRYPSFLKKLNRQERVVEEVKLVLKPHYNKKRVTKDEYKDILRRAVPKICHNKSGEINPSKIQALVEAYVKKFRKKHKLGLA